VINYSPTNLESIAKLNPCKKPVDSSRYVRLANPMSNEREYMRQTLLNGLLETCWGNLRHTDRVAIFEIGRVYLPKSGQVLPEEPRRIGIALIGSRFGKSWNSEKGEMDFYDLKGVIESILNTLAISKVEFRADAHPSCHPGRCACLFVNGENVGSLGELHPAVCDNFDLPQKRINVAELDLEKLIALAENVALYEKIPRYPAIGRDIAVVIDQSVAAVQVQNIIRQYGGSWLKRVSIFDQYSGEQIPTGKKSLAYALTYQADDRTLTDEEVNQAHSQILSAVERELGAQVRAS
jgi:phenylalanyl-tRNA synthetase beta chain